MYFVLILLLIVAILFALDKIRPDYIALSALVLLMLAGTLTPVEALQGFGNTTVILVAVLFIVGKGLTQTGITQLIGDAISTRIKEGQENRLVATIMSSTALLSSFMSSTGVVALFVPIVRQIAVNNKLNLKRLLLPMAYGGLIGGMLTLIATPPNLIVSEELRSQGYDPFQMLSFFPVGLAVLVAGIGYFILLNKLRKDIPKEKEAEEGEERMNALLEKYNVGGTLVRLKVTTRSTVLNKPMKETDFRQKYEANIIGVEVEGRLGSTISTVSGETRLQNGDILYVNCDEEMVAQIVKDKKLMLMPYLGVHRNRWRQQLALAELIIPYNSNFIGSTIEELGYITKSRLNVIGSHRVTVPTREKLKKLKLREGDSILAMSSREDLKSIRDLHHDLIVYNIPYEEGTKVNRTKAFTALSITVIMVVFLVLNLIPPVLTVLIAALALIGTRCVTMEEAYQSISLSTVVLIAAMLPFATAMEKTGAVDLIVNSVMGFFGDYGPHMMMTGLFLITVLLSSFISNTATAVILAPIAIKMAEQASISPYSLVMTLAIAASTAFLTPVASPVNMLVVGPGGYKFMDFVKSGFPLVIITLAICLLLIPVFFPF
jgi:di/tricarboxylate transporter